MSVKYQYFLNISKIITIIVLISLISKAQEDYELNEENESESENNSTHEIEFSSGDGMEEPNEENHCSAKEFITNLNISHYLPDDYENMKNENISRIVPHINHTFAKFERLMNWAKKVYDDKELNEAFKAIRSMSYDMVYELDLEPECLSAFLRIVNGMQKGKTWAFKCKFS
jgi:hypothetical protein